MSRFPQRKESEQKDKSEQRDKSDEKNNLNRRARPGRRISQKENRNTSASLNGREAPTRKPAIEGSLIGIHESKNNICI
jgi:hypothetical protein